MKKFRIQDPISKLYYSCKELPETNSDLIYRKGNNGSLISALFDPENETHIINTVFSSRGKMFRNEKEIKKILENDKSKGLNKILKRCIIVETSEEYEKDRS
jgi:hypothetical protein